MVEKISALYDESRSHFSKRLNLALRGWIYCFAYLPKLQKFDVFKNAKVAVEIGAGYGTKLHHTARKIPFVNFRGVEQSPTMVSYGECWYPGVAGCMEIGDATNLLTLNDEEVDVLMYYQILHHLDWGQLEEAMKEALRVLRPGGKIAVIETFLNDSSGGFNQMRRVVFNTIEPIYSLISTKTGGGYKNQPQKAFTEFMTEQGFVLTHKDEPFGKLSVSEILVFEKN